MKKNMIIMGCSFLIIIGIVYFLRNLSFTEFNIYPQKISNEFLEKTYGKKFILMDTVFYKKNGYYIWEMQYKDEDGVEFNEYFFHPLESSFPGGAYLFFDKRYVEHRLKDYYWQIQVENKYGAQFNLEKFRTEVGYAMPMYCFDISDEDDIRGVADIITTTLDYISKSAVQLPDYAIGAYNVKYMGESICLIHIDREMKEFAEEDYDVLFQFVYDEIYNSFIEVKL